jgi:hypothetical protein
VATSAKNPGELKDEPEAQDRKGVLGGLVADAGAATVRRGHADVAEARGDAAVAGDGAPALGSVPPPGRYVVRLRSAGSHAADVQGSPSVSRRAIAANSMAPANRGRRVDTPE